MHVGMWEAAVQLRGDPEAMSWRRGWSGFWWRGICGRGKQGSQCPRDGLNFLLVHSHSTIEQQLTRQHARRR